MNRPCDGLLTSLASLFHPSSLISQQIEKYQKKWLKLTKSQKKNQHKISKISKELNKLKELKISDDIKKILQAELSNKRSGLDRTINKSKGIKKPTF